MRILNFSCGVSEDERLHAVSLARYFVGLIYSKSDNVTMRRKEYLSLNCLDKTTATISSNRVDYKCHHKSCFMA